MTENLEPPLSGDELKALRASCEPVSVLAMLPPDALLTLIRHDYVQIVFGGVQITTSGLKRLICEADQPNRPPHARSVVADAQSDMS